MDIEEFRTVGHELVDWCAAYFESLEDVRVRPLIEPGWVRAQLPAAPPAAPEPWSAIVADLDRVVVPALVHWQSPRFHAPSIRAMVSRIAVRSATGEASSASAIRLTAGTGRRSQCGTGRRE